MIQEFFLVTLPGLEDLVLAELKAWFPRLEGKVEVGGVTVQAPLTEGLAMNLALKLPTRVLLRVATFTCRDFPKLYNKVASFNWGGILDPGSTLTVHASAHRSRLKIKKRIEETCADGWLTHQKQIRAKPSGQAASLYVRLYDNLCTLSLDTSGERLHKRGARALIGEAPLRETLAAAMIQLVAQTYAASPSAVELLDPMMGSGTILLEAAVRDRLVDQRGFAFESFVAQPVLPAAPSSSARFTRLVGFEVDAKTCAAARANLQNIGLEIETHNQDFFAIPPLPARAECQRWVINNPPYGERLKVRGSLPEYYAHLFAQCEKVAHPDRACFLLPATAGRLILPAAWKVLEKRRLSNGGIAVLAYVFGRVDPS